MGFMDELYNHKKERNTSHLQQHQISDNPKNLLNLRSNYKF